MTLVGVRALKRREKFSGRRMGGQMSSLLPEGEGGSKGWMRGYGVGRVEQRNPSPFRATLIAALSGAQALSRREREVWWVRIFIRAASA